MEKKNNAIIITSIIASVVLLIAIIGFSTLSLFSPYSKDSVTVEGVSEIEATPDLITVYFNIQTNGDTSSEAKDENNEIFESLISELAIQGFDKSELKTQSFSIYPDYIWEKGQRKDNGYKATHSLKLELSSEEFDKISEVIDAGVDSGAGISYINFELSQELQSQYKAQALELASKDARVKAEAVAKGFDKKIGKLVSVSVNDFGYYPWNIYTARSAAGEQGYEEDIEIAKETTINIEPSEQTINARVSAVYKLR
jgi:hypothetical protein